jgi:heat shock gene repressor HrcA
MADLEEMGYIVQPHTSAGRIPSDKGYRFYVDQMMQEKDKEVSEMKELLLEKEEKMEHLLKQVAKVLAVNTNYATMISAPQYHHNKLKFIQLSRVDEHQILAVVVAEGNVIKNSIIPVKEKVDDELNAKELAKAIRAFLDTLPDREQDIFLRRYFYVEDPQTIAQRHKIRRSNVNLILSRTRAKLKAYLTQEGYNL